jgi:hypothetical protein
MWALAATSTRVDIIMSDLFDNDKEEEKGFLSIFNSMEEKKLEKLLGDWNIQVRNGHIKRLNDPDVQFSVLEILGTNVQQVYIELPSEPTKTLGVKMPVLILLVKNVWPSPAKKIFLLLDRDPRRQGHQAQAQLVQLPVDNSGQAFLLLDADEVGRGLE